MLEKPDLTLTDEEIKKQTRAAVSDKPKFSLAQAWRADFFEEAE